MTLANAFRAVLEPLGLDVVRISRNPLSRDAMLSAYVARRHVRDLVEWYGIDVVVDVGANEGQYAMGLRRAGYKGRIVSFEPVAKTYDVLASRSRDDGSWDVYPWAAGEEDGARDIHVLARSEFNSFGSPTPYAQEQYGGAVDVERSERVEIRRLDSVLPGLVGGPSRMLLKVDTQGHDREVLVGAGDLLEEVLVVQVELSFRPLYEEGCGFVEMLTWLTEAGFTPAGFFPVARDRHTLGLIEVDCLLVRPDRRPATR